MNEEYIKKLEEDNKRLEETLARYVARYGDTPPEPFKIKTDEDNGFLTNVSSNMKITSFAPSNAFLAHSANGNMIAVNDKGIEFKSNNITFDCQNVISTIESDTIKELKELKKLLEISQRKPKPKFKRYCRVALKKLKRKFK